MVTEQQFEQLRGRPVRAGDDAEIGTVAEVFLGYRRQPVLRL